MTGTGLRRHASTAVIAVTLVACLIITGSFYLVSRGTAVIDVVTLLGAFGTLSTALIALLVKQDRQGEQLSEIRANTNHLLEKAIGDAVAGGVIEAAAGAARLRKAQDDEDRGA